MQSERPEAESTEVPESAHAFGWPEALRIALIAVAAIAVRLRLWEPVATLDAVGIVGVVIGGWPIFREAAGNLAARRMTMELSMSIAILAAAAIGEFFTALIITLFVLIAEVLENMTVASGRRAIRDLLDFLPRSVVVRRDGAVRQASADELRPGDCVLVNPGALVAADGVVDRDGARKVSRHWDESTPWCSTKPARSLSGAPRRVPIVAPGSRDFFQREKMSPSQPRLQRPPATGLLR
jgi:Cd2+/Zn2+-exporting ATPase/Cu+-exporting ATPase